MTPEPLGGGFIRDMRPTDQRRRYAPGNQYLRHTSLFGFWTIGPPLGGDHGFVQGRDPFGGWQEARS